MMFKQDIAKQSAAQVKQVHNTENNLSYSNKFQI